MKHITMITLSTLLIVFGLFTTDTQTIQAGTHPDSSSTEALQAKEHKADKEITLKKKEVKSFFPEDSLNVHASSKIGQAIQKKQVYTKEITVEATAYTAHCKGCSGITKTGINLLKNPDQKVIAVDPNVIPLGSKVYIEGYGTAVAGDIGSAIKGNRIDLYMQNRQDALKFGRQTIKVKLLS